MPRGAQFDDVFRILLCRPGLAGRGLGRLQALVAFVIGAKGVSTVYGNRSIRRDTASVWRTRKWALFDLPYRGVYDGLM